MDICAESIRRRVRRLHFYLEGVENRSPGQYWWATIDDLPSGRDPVEVTCSRLCDVAIYNKDLLVLLLHTKLGVFESALCSGHFDWPYTLVVTPLEACYSQRDRGLRLNVDGT